MNFIDTAPPLKVPFPVMGGKSRVAHLVWERFGDVRNYIEPFCFGSAVLLRRPGGCGPIETINDLNCYVSNFWRAVRADPDAVAEHADWPVIEADVHARHKWLLHSEAAQYALNQVRDDPDFYDARMAGWWCWGACCWIGTGWCEHAANQIIDAHCAGQGINTKRPGLCNGNTTRGPGVLAHAKRPDICDRFGKGVNGPSPQIPHMTDCRGVNQRPKLADAFARGLGVNFHDDAEACQNRREWLTDWMRRLADRMRPVRVCNGHWARVCNSDSTLTRLGLTGVFLDPPYRTHIDGKKNRTANIYANDIAQDVNALCDEVWDWCKQWGSNPQIRIALCGYEGEYPEADELGWKKIEWKGGGYGNRTDAGKENAARERIWFNPSCIKPGGIETLFN